MKMITKFWKNEEGAELLEIAVYAGLFIVVAAVALALLGPNLSTFFYKLGTNVSTILRPPAASS